MIHFLFEFLALLILVVHCASLEFYDGLVNNQVQVSTYLTTPVTKILVNTKVSNAGDQPADTYVIAIPKNLINNLSSIEAVDAKTEEPLRTTEIPNLTFGKNQKFDTDPRSAVYYSIPLPRTLVGNSDDSVQIKVTIAYVHLLDPLPSHIKKSGKQYVTYENNRYFYSPYVTNKMNVKFTLASDKIKSYTKPAKVQDKKITYGPYSDIAALSISNVRFHYQFHVPFLTMTKVERDIEISHWGNVRIEDSYLLRHDGAKLKGAYEPGLMDRRFSSGDPSVVTDLKASLPKTAHGVYYVDRIGNVSTSNFRAASNTKKANSVLEMRPRYPLYGGWSTDFIIGYDVPSRDMISYDPNTLIHTLNVTFGIPFREPVTDLLVTTIALPEGAHDIEVDCPYDIDLTIDGVYDDGTPMRRFTYLDTRILGGRPLVVFSRRNVASLHNKHFQIRYKYDKNRIYFKPILIISGIFVFLVTILIFARINPSLEDEQEELLRKETLLAHAPQIVHAGKKGGNGGGNTGGGGSGSGHSSRQSSRHGSTASSMLTDANVDVSGVKEALNRIDPTNQQANSILKQLKKLKESVKHSRDDHLKNKVNEAYNKAKKNREKKEKLVRIVEDLQSNI